MPLKEFEGAVEDCVINLLTNITTEVLSEINLPEEVSVECGSEDHMVVHNAIAELVKEDNITKAVRKVGTNYVLVEGDFRHIWNDPTHPQVLREGTALITDLSKLLATFWNDTGVMTVTSNLPGLRHLRASRRLELVLAKLQEFFNIVITLNRTDDVPSTIASVQIEGDVSKFYGTFYGLSPDQLEFEVAAILNQEEKVASQ